jgi:hypothetical protein
MNKITNSLHGTRYRFLPSGKFLRQSGSTCSSAVGVHVVFAPPRRGCVGKRTSAEFDALYVIDRDHLEFRSDGLRWIPLRVRWSCRTFPGKFDGRTTPRFCRIQLANPGEKRESLAIQTPSQSPGLTTWNRNIDRVGGLRFKNSTGDPVIFPSLATLAKYDPKDNVWHDLRELPEPRSSLDAAVVDGRLDVVGGWNLKKRTAEFALAGLVTAMAGTLILIVIANWLVS